MTSQIPTQPCKSVLLTLPPHFLQVVSAHAKSLQSVLMSIVDSIPHAAPIMIPIVVTGFLAQWIYNVYKQSYAFLLCYVKMLNRASQGTHVTAFNGLHR